MKRISLIIFLFLFSLVISAQGASFICLSPDAYTMGMGGASVALDANAFALYNNPAAMALFEKKGAVAASYGLWQPSAANSKLFSAAGFGKIKEKAAFGLGGRFITHQPYDITNDKGVITGKYTPREYALETGAAYRIWRFSLGAAFRFIASDLGADKPGFAFCADVALMYKSKTLSVAASVANLGTRISYGDTASYALPAMAKLGLAYNINFHETNRISFGLEGDFLFNGGVMVGGGIEYSIKETGFVRCGYHYGNANNSIPSYFSLGLGGKIKGVSLNAAYLIASSKSPIKNSLSLSLQYEF